MKPTLPYLTTPRNNLCAGCAEVFFVCTKGQRYCTHRCAMESKRPGRLPTPGEIWREKHGNDYQVLSVHDTEEGLRIRARLAWGRDYVVLSSEKWRRRFKRAEVQA